jgi:hypothetical protein
VHQEHAADALLAILGGVDDAGTAFEPAGIDAAEGDGADEGIVHDLEGEHRQWLAVDGLRTTSLPLLSMPLIGGTSSGDGRKSTTASSSGCTPLFLKADPRTRERTRR